MKPRSLEEDLREVGVLVCAGTGGVGKTTIAAALAIQAAKLGRRTLVLTIDPARRLADALGLDTLDSVPTRVDLSRPGLEESGPRPIHLDAMMLDPKPTFDRLITRLARDDAERERILGNRIYQHLSSALAGSAEYAAMEQVYEQVHSGEHDLIIVDTPPSDHALDFLRTPRRLREFLDSRFVQALVRPAMSASRLGFRLFGRPLHRMLGLLERIAGVGFLDDLSEFLSAIDGLSEGFQERAARVEEILLGPDTGFVLISAAHAGSQRTTIEFMRELAHFDVPLIALIVNRLRPWPLATSPADQLRHCSAATRDADHARLVRAFRDSTGPAGAPRDPDRLMAAVLETVRICDAEQRIVETLATTVADAGIPCLRVPELPGHVDRIDGLLEIGSALLAPVKPRVEDP
ncbi:MAG TPA: ArsA family ATPase [Deltaproteobacteria bacterium]|nr:ArsA family ATPase [Deltaproteobacteria bacterium]